MAVEYTEVWSERKQTKTYDEDGFPVWTAVRAWDVVTTSEDTAINSVPEAQYMATHDSTTSLKVKNNSVASIGFNVKRVSANYDIPKDDNQGTSPLLQPVEYSFDETETIEQTDRDSIGFAIRNSAGDAHSDGGGDRALVTMRYVIYINQPYYDHRMAVKFFNKYNKGTFSTPFGTYDRGEVLCKYILPVEKFTKYSKYVKCAYGFDIRLREDFPGMPAGVSPFDIRKLDQGLNGFYKDDNGVLQQEKICFASGQPVNGPVRLNGKGKPSKPGMKLLNGRTPVDGPEPRGALIEEVQGPGNDGVTVYLWWARYAPADFGALNLSFR